MSGIALEQLANPVRLLSSLCFAPGTIVILQGGSGAGKSRFLRAVADLDPNDGVIKLEDLDRQEMSGPAWRRRVMYVPAEAGWWSDRVVDHFELWNLDRVEGLLADMGMPPDTLEWPVARLSTGERQRLALIRAIVRSPDVMLLDEPTSGLDTVGVERVEAVLQRELDRGVLIILVTHDPAQATRLGQRFLIADNMSIREASIAKEVLA